MNVMSSSSLPVDLHVSVHRSIWYLSIGATMCHDACLRDVVVDTAVSMRRHESITRKVFHFCDLAFVRHSSTQKHHRPTDTMRSDTRARTVNSLPLSLTEFTPSVPAVMVSAACIYSASSVETCKLNSSCMHLKNTIGPGLHYIVE